MFISAILAQEPCLFLAGFVSAYGMAGFGHFTIEKNKPAAFSRPVLSFLSNFKMPWPWLKGKINNKFEATLPQKAEPRAKQSTA